MQTVSSCSFHFISLKKFLDVVKIKFFLETFGDFLSFENSVFELTDAFLLVVCEVQNKNQQKCDF